MSPRPRLRPAIAQLCLAEDLAQQRLLTLEALPEGGNIDEVRPTMIIPDDIDDRKMSPVIAEKNLSLFTTESCRWELTAR